MTAMRPFLDLQRTSAAGRRPHSPGTTPLRLTARGEFVFAFAIFLGVFLLMWTAAALGFWITGVEG